MDNCESSKSSKILKFRVLNIFLISRLMLPYGYTRENPPRIEILTEIGTAGQTAIASKHGTQYQLGTIANIICEYKITVNDENAIDCKFIFSSSDVASGSSVDWVYDILQPEFALAYELRDSGVHGFALPADQIIPTAEETLDSIVAMLKKTEEIEG